MKWHATQKAFRKRRALGLGERGDQIRIAAVSSAKYNIPRGGGAEFGRGFLPVRTVRVASGQQWGLRIQDLS